mmetsp:Transcript_42400/g.68048  ORF Transcript_42400/g.68048 Transcript_42400/m.68048 type:complete len:285 (+) Transcript_42400:6229-7083(+)
MENQPDNYVFCDETAYDLFTRDHSGAFVRTGFSTVDKRTYQDSSYGFDRDVVEVRGKSQSGKTEFCMYTAVTTVLPEALGGSNASVLYFDLENRLNPERLVNILANRVEAAMLDDKNSVLSDRQLSEAKQIVAACMKRIVILKCSGSQEVLATLWSISDEYIDESKLKLIVVDSIGSFYWEDIVVEPVNVGIHVSVPTAILDLVKRHQISIVATKNIIFGGVYGEYLSQTWQKLVSTRLLLECEDGFSTFACSQIGTQDRKLPLTPLFRFRITPVGIKSIPHHQ